MTKSAVETEVAIDVQQSYSTTGAGLSIMTVFSLAIANGLLRYSFARCKLPLMNNEAPKRVSAGGNDDNYETEVNNTCMYCK